MSGKRRKAVLVIVEGPSDAEALEHPFNKMFNPDEVRVNVVHGDITADKNSMPSNIASAVGKLVKDHASKYGLKRGDFLRVIQVVDTDGAYIPDANVVEDNGHVGSPVYSETEIRAAPKSNIMARNRRKRANLDRLSSAGCVWTTIPYSVYYMSCNLDHVLHGVQNSSDEDKAKNASVFAKKYYDDLDGFLNFISDPIIAVAGEYKDTWAFIREGLSSLQRHTNLALCFKR